MNPDYRLQQLFLPHKAVLIQCLDENLENIPGATSSGFICHENGANFLYTCWHVVTGYDMHSIREGRDLPKRAFLRVTMQRAENRPLEGHGPVETILSVGGSHTITLPLYHKRTRPMQPTWYQDKDHNPHFALNSAGIRVPYMHDAVKLRLPDELLLAPMQVIRQEEKTLNSSLPGDKMIIVGYPYGFSTLGLKQPTPIVLTRYVASTGIEKRFRDYLLDGAGAPGMSGGPVFTTDGLNIRLAGIYTGMVYPDHIIGQYQRATVLGTFTPLSICWEHHPLRSYEEVDDNTSQTQPC